MNQNEAYSRILEGLVSTVVVALVVVGRGLVGGLWGCK